MQYSKDPVRHAEKKEIEAFCKLAEESAMWDKLNNFDYYDAKQYLRGEINLSQDRIASVKETYRKLRERLGVDK